MGIFDFKLVDIRLQGRLGLFADKIWTQHYVYVNMWKAELIYGVFVSCPYRMNTNIFCHSIIGQSLIKKEIKYTWYNLVLHLFSFFHFCDDLASSSGWLNRERNGENSLKCNIYNFLTNNKILKNISSLKKGWFVKKKRPCTLHKNNSRAGYFISNNHYAKEGQFFISFKCLTLHNKFIFYI